MGLAPGRPAKRGNKQRISRDTLHRWRPPFQNVPPMLFWRPFHGIFWLIYTYLISLKSPICQEPLQALYEYELDRLRTQPLHGFVTKQIEDQQKSLRSKVGFSALVHVLASGRKGSLDSITHTHILGHFCCHVLENLMLAISVQVKFYEFMTHCPVIYTAQPEKGEPLSPFIHTTMQVRCQSAGFAFPWRLLDWKCLGEQIWVVNCVMTCHTWTLWHTSRLCTAHHQGSAPPLSLVSKLIAAVEQLLQSIVLPKELTSWSVDL